MKLFTKSFLLVVSLLLVGEASVRIFWSRSMSGRFEYGYNMTAGFEEENNAVNLVRAGGRRFHPQSFDTPKPAGVVRVFVIGDSVPRGPSLKKAYAYQLEKILKAKEIKAEVFNLGVPGYGARRSQIVLKQVIKYQPDLIIRHVNWTNEYEDEREYRRAQAFKSWQPKNWLMKSMLLARLNESQTENLFWKLLPPEIRMQRGINDTDAEIAASQNDEKRGEWRRFVVEKSIEDARILKGAGVPGLFIIQAKVHKTAKGNYSLSDDGMDSLQTLLSKEGMNTLSMKDVFSHDSDLKIFFSDGSHLYPLGHQRMAEVLAFKLTPFVSTK